MRSADNDLALESRKFILRDRELFHSSGGGCSKLFTCKNFTAAGCNKSCLARGNDGAEEKVYVRACGLINSLRADVTYAFARLDLGDLARSKLACGILCGILLSVP